MMLIKMEQNEYLKKYGKLIIILAWAAAILYTLATMVGYYETGGTLSLKNILPAFVWFAAAIGISIYVFTKRGEKAVESQEPKML